ncbi:hypothetical protein FNU76_07810 [Chitinimonas arctica]|uniref:Uncharacterized protein n=1 Tax=Chitinimonas arctica TaxID=2594795 RepID=A0A516SDN8_9NEIS|nr:hypothetical protein [Chitinimonas arctica]QDQ26273.1 hypothetical protein FNU76_07810 [Chitinimonas arctica]
MQVKKSTELVVVGGMLALSLISSYADAAAVVISDSPTSQTATVATASAGGYVLEEFRLNLSANVKLAYDGDGQAVAVKTGNKKGMHTFGGSSNGGSVKQCEATSLASSAVLSGAATVNVSAGC